MSKLSLKCSLHYGIFTIFRMRKKIYFQWIIWHETIKLFLNMILKRLVFIMHSVTCASNGQTIPRSGLESQVSLEWRQRAPNLIHSLYDRHQRSINRQLIISQQVFFIYVQAVKVKEWKTCTRSGVLLFVSLLKFCKSLHIKANCPKLVVK